MISIFDRYYNKYDKWYEKNKFVYLSELEAIKKVLPKKGKILEIGVGTGRFAAALGIEFGIDPSMNMLKIARHRGVNTRLARGEQLPFRDLTFDCVAIIITLCFSQDAEKVLQETSRVLKKNGRLIVAIIDKDTFLGRFYQRKRSVFYKQARFFGINEIRSLLRNSGFNRFSYYQTIFQLPSDINSIEMPRRGFGRGGFLVISARKKIKRRFKI